MLCHSCREKFPKSELIQITKSKRVCKSCQEKATTEANDYRELIEYICTGFGIKAPTGQQLKSIKQFKELGYSYKEIQYTIYYIYSVINKKVEGTGLGLVPYYYEEAKKHFSQIENARRSATKITTQEIVIERKVDTFNPNIKNTRLINIEELI